MHTFGKQSLSNTKACNNCPVATGINNQLPHHHGFLLNHPSSSNALYANSNDLVPTYIAMVILNWSPGYTPNAKPARLAPIAGARRDVREREMRGFRRRKGAASLVRRFERRREKKRKRRRWRSRMRDSERESRRLGDLKEVFRVTL